MQQSESSTPPPDPSRPLTALRVLELPGAPSLPAGKAFADLGADVIKIEPPGGDPARSLPPFADTADCGRLSLYWAAYSLGKRSVTADLETDAGRETVRRLAADADVLIESFAPGVLASLGLGADTLRAANPRLIVTSITSFGQTGPYAQRHGSDLVHFALGCYLNMTGPRESTPIKPSAPYQTWLHGSMQAVAATLLSLRGRRKTGHGTHVDQAMRDTVPWMLTHTYQFYDLLGINLRRYGSQRDLGGTVRLPVVYRCADGYVVWLFQTGHIGGRNTAQIVAWMAAEGMAPDWLLELNWQTVDLITAGEEMANQLARVFGAFLLTRTKAELLAWALPKGVMLAPVQTLADVLEDVQLHHRSSWRTVELGGGLPPVRVPGPPIRLGDGGWEPHTSLPARSESGVWRDESGVRGPGSGLGDTPSPAETEGKSGESNSALPLTGLRVLDFSTTVAGPSAVRHLADFGAEVIKVESEVHPDTLRTGTPYAGRTAGLNRSGYFAAYNAGKLSLTLKMTRPEGREILRKLIEKSDVLVEAFVPGVMERWGLTWEQVHEWNPRLILASHCLQGQWGPHAKHRGYGQIAGAMTGWYDLTGLPGGEPLGPYSAYTDFISWPFLLSAILVALERREETGKGQHIDHAQLETSLHFFTPALLDLQLNGRMATRRGNWEDYAAPNNAYRALGRQAGRTGEREDIETDRWVALTVTSDDEWAALAAALGHPEAAADPRFTTLSSRKEHEAALDELIAGWVVDEEPYALAERLQAAGLAAGVVVLAQDLFADPQLQHRGFFRRLDHAEMGSYAVHRQSFLIEGMDPGPWRPAPLLGEHTDYVLRDVLGLTDEEIAGYAVSGVFQ